MAADDRIDNAQFINELFGYANSMSSAAGENATSLKQFLDISATECSHYTAANRLLIQGYFPEATDVKRLSEWESLGYSVNPDAFPIYLLEKEKDKNGNGKEGYVARLCYDISQTNAFSTEKKYDRAYLTESILKCAPCSIKYVDRINDTRVKAIYKSGTDEINVTSGFKSYDEVFCTLAREYVHAGIYGKVKELELSMWNKEIKEIKEGNISPTEKFTPSAYKRSKYITHADAAAYVTAKYFGIDTEALGFNFNEIPAGFYGTKEVNTGLNGKNNYEALEKHIKTINNTLTFVTDHAHKLCKKIESEIGKTMQTTYDKDTPVERGW